MLGNILVHASLTEVIMWLALVIGLVIGGTFAIYDAVQTKFRQLRKKVDLHLRLLHNKHTANNVGDRNET